MPKARKTGFYSKNPKAWPEQLEIKSYRFGHYMNVVEFDEIKNIIVHDFSEDV